MLRGMNKARWWKTPLAVLGVLGLLATGTAVAGAALPTTIATIYDGVPAAFPGSFPSLGYEATSTDEFGDHIAFAGASRHLTTVDVSLTSWTCQNDFASNGSPLRDADHAHASPLPAAATRTRSPSTSTRWTTGGRPGRRGTPRVEDGHFHHRLPAVVGRLHVTANGGTPETYQPFGGMVRPGPGQVRDRVLLHDHLRFHRRRLVLPDEVIYGIAYDTATSGAAPIGVAGDYSWLNVSLAEVAPSVGTDVEDDTTFWDSSYGPFYCDGGTGGSDTFRRDAGCWAPYVPVIRFNTESPVCAGCRPRWSAPRATTS